MAKRMKAKKHDDEAQDRALFKRMEAEEEAKGGEPMAKSMNKPMMGMKHGGRVKMKDGGMLMGHDQGKADPKGGHGMVGGGGKKNPASF